MTTLDVDAARAVTPGCEHILHLNHAGASLAPQPVLDATIDHLHREAQMGGYEAAAAVADQLEDVYASVARLLGADVDEVALLDSSTRGWDTVAYGLSLSPGDRVITTRAEYGANAIALLQLRERTGCEIVLVDDDEHGQLDLGAMASAIEQPRTALVSVVHVPTQSGLVNPIVEVGRLCRAAGVPYLVDACQSAGQLPLDVEEIGCDALAGAGRKFLRGPRGTGFLYVRRNFLDRLDPPMLDLHSATWTSPDTYERRSDARRFELFEHSAASRLGLGAAVDHALGWGLEAIAERNRALADGLRARLGAIPGVTVRDRGRDLCAITTFTVDGVDATEVVRLLHQRGVNTLASMAAFAQHDLPHRGLDAVVRASVHYITTDEELDRAAEDVAVIAAG